MYAECLTQTLGETHVDTKCQSNDTQQITTLSVLWLELDEGGLLPRVIISLSVFRTHLAKEAIRRAPDGKHSTSSVAFGIYRVSHSVGQFVLFHISSDKHELYNKVKRKQKMKRDTFGIHHTSCVFTWNNLTLLSLIKTTGLPNFCSALS